MTLGRGKKLRLEPTYQCGYLKAKQEIENARKMEAEYRNDLAKVENFSPQYWTITKNLNRVVTARIEAENRLKDEEFVIEALKGEAERQKLMIEESKQYDGVYDMTVKGPKDFFGSVKVVCLEHSKPGKPTPANIMRSEDGSIVVCSECATFDNPSESLYLDGSVFVLCRLHCPDGNAIEAFVRPNGKEVLVLCPDCIEDGKATRERFKVEVDPENVGKLKAV